MIESMPHATYSMSKKLIAFCLLSLGFTLLLLLDTPPSLHAVKDGPTDDHRTYRGPHAIATFLGSNYNRAVGDSDEDEPYYVSVRTLVWQLLHCPSTRLQSPVPIIVGVTPDVHESKRRRLQADGATVVEVEYVAHQMVINVERWRDTAAKLRLFDPRIVPYEKALMMDADVVLTHPIDAIFSDPGSARVQVNDTSAELGPVPDTYIMGASPEMPQRDQTDSSEQEMSRFNVGLLLYSPSRELFDYYMRLLRRPDSWYTGAPDQDLINCAHQRDGPMPWRHLHGSWYINEPKEEDLTSDTAVLHTKWWMDGESHASDRVREFAHARRWEMEGYWMATGEGR